jgi:hypothetical protein
MWVDSDVSQYWEKRTHSSDFLQVTAIPEVSEVSTVVTKSGRLIR